MPAPDRKRRLTAFMVAMAVLIATPLAVVAADAFTDVPESNVHHDDITWLRDADVTRGCNPPDNTEFCPGDPVLRQQMASFMRRLAENQVVDAATAMEAEDSDMLDGMDSSEFLQTGTITNSIGGVAWLPHNIAPNTENRGVSGVTFAGNGAAVLALVAPQDYSGVTHGLQDLQICYRAPNTGYIRSIQIYRTNNDATADLVFTDNTDRTSNAECLVLSPELDAGEGLGVYANLDGGGTVRLEGVKATWSTAAALQTQGLSDSDPSVNDS